LPKKRRTKASFTTATFSERFRFGPGRRSSFTLEAMGVSRPDYMYYGLGPDTQKGELMRYGQDRLQGRLTFETRPTTGTRCPATAAAPQLPRLRG